MDNKKPSFFDNALPYLGLSAVALICGSYFLYSALIAYDVPINDYWDWMVNMFLPYEAGDISFLEYLTGAFLPFRHSHVPTLILFYLNYSLFDLRFYVECIVGMAATAAIYIFLIRKYFSSTETKLDRRYLIISACALTAILLNPFNIMVNPLVQFEYLYLLLAVVYLSIYDNVLKNNISQSAFYAYTFAYFFIGDAMGTASILAVLIHVLLVTPKEMKFRHLAGMVVVLATASVLATIFFTYKGPTIAPETDQLAYIFSHKLDTIQLIINGYAQGLVDQYSIVQRLVGARWPIFAVLIGVAMLSLNLFAFWLYFSRRKSIGTALPGLLIIFSAVIICGILLTRFPAEGPLYSLNDRYQRQGVIGVFGSYWIFAIVFFGSADEKTIKSRILSQYGKPLLAAATLFIFLNGAVSHTVMWKYYFLGKKDSLERIARGIIAYSEDSTVDLNQYVTKRHCRDGSCKEAVQFLKENELSVFRPSHVIYQDEER